MRGETTRKKLKSKITNPLDKHAVPLNGDSNYRATINPAS